MERSEKIEMPETIVETYFFEIEDSSGKYWYMVASQKMETESTQMIKIGEVYEMEINMFEWHGLTDWGQTYIHINGIYIPVPPTGWSDRVYVSPNLQGLYYVKDPVTDAGSEIEESE